MLPQVVEGDSTVRPLPNLERKIWNNPALDQDLQLRAAHDECLLVERCLGTAHTAPTARRVATANSGAAECLQCKDDL